MASRRAFGTVDSPTVRLGLVAHLILEYCSLLRGCRDTNEKLRLSLVSGVPLFANDWTRSSFVAKAARRMLTDPNDCARLASGVAVGRSNSSSRSAGWYLSSLVFLRRLLRLPKLNVRRASSSMRPRPNPSTTGLFKGLRLSCPSSMINVSGQYRPLSTGSGTEQQLCTQYYVITCMGKRKNHRIARHKTNS